jgi:hypothetical protein
MFAKDVAGVANDMASSCEALKREIPVIVRSATQKAERRVGERLEAHGPLVVIEMTNGATFETEYVDVSEGGLRIIDVGRLSLGQAIKARFPDGDTVPAKVVWIREGHCGIAFNQRNPAILRFAIDKAA